MLGEDDVPTRQAERPGSDCEEANICCLRAPECRGVRRKGKRPARFYLYSKSSSKSSKHSKSSSKSSKHSKGGRSDDSSCSDLSLRQKAKVAGLGAEATFNAGIKNGMIEASGSLSGSFGLGGGAKTSVGDQKSKMVPFSHSVAFWRILA